MAVIAEDANEAEVRALFDSYFDAIRAAYLDRITGHYAPDIVAYDAVMELEFTGREAYRAHWKACLEMCQDAFFEPREPRIVAGGDVALAHCLLHCGGTGPDGQTGSSWMRVTIAARKHGGRWQIVHEHYSMPFDPMSQKVLDLKPAA